MELDQTTANMLAEWIITKSDSINREARTRRFQCEHSSTFQDAREKAMKLSCVQAHEVWCALQLLINKKSLEGHSAAVVSLANEFDPFPRTWEILASKALEYEHFRNNR